MKKFTLLFVFILLQHSIFSQRGKDGTVTIGAGSSVVNAYTSLSTDASAGTTTINVLSSSGYTTGDLIYIIQMQGAAVNCYTNQFANPQNPDPQSPAFGKIVNYNNAGNNEFAEIAAINGNTITFNCALKNNYTAAGKVQAVKVPRYSALTVTGTITCAAWNGTIGGVIAIEVLGNTTINSSGRINASALGFRGGFDNGKLVGGGGGSSWGRVDQAEGAFKGEGIAGDTALYHALFNGPRCKGAVANAGGGGNSNNAGGGGGANAGDTGAYTGLGNPDISLPKYITAWNLEPGFSSSATSSGGGRGGYTFCDVANNPTVTPPGNGNNWGGDNRRVEGGIGGRPLNYNSGRLFLGGGGGGGDENDGYGGSGGNGGGIINIISYGTVSGTGQIISNGAPGANTSTVLPALNNVRGRDGAGGGGAGGAIVVKSVGSINTITLSANGGQGGNQQMVSNISFGTTAMAYGPGGGGGGGYIGTTPAAVTSSVTGGSNGIVVYLSGTENCLIDNHFPPNGATKGGGGVITSTLSSPETLTATTSVTICANNTATLLASNTGTGTIGWYSSSTGGTLLGTGTAFTTSVLTTVGVYTVYAGFCPGGTYRVPSLINVTTSPTISVTTPTICSGQTATITASGASTYTWSTGANTPSITPTLITTTTYTINGANGTCSATAIGTVIVNSGGTITVNSPTICSGQSATLTAGAASSYTWSTAQNTVSILVTPSVSTNYTISATNASGCILTNTSTVTVNTTPTVSVNSTTICTATTATLIASGASTYTWNTGATTSIINPSPASTTIYTIIGANGICTNVKTATVNVNPTPTISVNSATICSGNSATLTASGATTFTWNTGANTAIINPSPSSTTVYTISGTSSNCSDVKTSTVTVINTPTVSANSATTCVGSSTTLTATGATSYLWNTSATTSAIVVSPTVTTSYTVTGSNGICSSTAISTLVVSPTGVISVNSATICSGQSATLIAGAASGYTWSNAANTNSIIVNPSVTTNYTINATSGGCQLTNTATVTVNTTPTVTVNSTTICSGNSATLTANGATTYSWNTGASTAVINPSPLSTTIYTITGTNGSCSNIKTATVMVNTTPTVSVNSGTLCSGNSATLIAFGASNYTWSTGANTNSIQVNPSTTTVYTITGSNGNCSGINTSTLLVTQLPSVSIISSGLFCNGQTITLTANGADSYTWSTNETAPTITVTSSGNYTITGSAICGNSTNTLNVVFAAPPSVSLSATQYTICPNQTTTLSANGSNGGNVYSWADFPSNSSNSQTVSTGGTFLITYTNSCGTSSSNITITQSTLTPSFAFSPTGGSAPITINFNNTSTNNLTNNWAFGNGQTFSGINPGIIIYSTPGLYNIELTIQNSDGCTAVTSQLIEVLPSEFGPIPEAITPNGDGNNDVFKINGIEKYPSNELYIYNRWGSLVYSMKGYANNAAWEGKANAPGKTGGNKLPAGTYYYLLILNDEAGQSFRGFCELMY
ncbi:MAG: gliding motility-associated C-terminal domain-containing protein [Bacteroidetes bacterium]|nr:gliding motility-associated C-terminal domain-containing protein [Bacteroidota bacterium]